MRNLAAAYVQVLLCGLRLCVLALLAALLAGGYGCGRSGRAASSALALNSGVPIVSVPPEEATARAALAEVAARPLVVLLEPDGVTPARMVAARWNAAAGSISLTTRCDERGLLLAYVALPAGCSLEGSEFSREPVFSLVLEAEPGVVAVGALLPDGATGLALHLAPRSAAAKSASKVPVDAGNSVELTVTDAGGPELAWTERNLGDYNLDSTVAISDVTPIAMFFGHLEGGADWDAWHEAVDGNGDDAISIADITPIAMHFGNRVTGYRVLRHPGGAGEWEALQVVARPFNPAAPGQPKQLPAYSYHDASPLAAAYYAVQPADGEGSYGISSSIAAFGSPAGPVPEPPPVETVEPPPDEIVLALGEVALLPELAAEESYTLPTASGQEYVLVLTSPQQVAEGPGFVPEDFQVAVSYGAAGASAPSTLPPPANRSWTAPSEAAGGADLAAEQARIVRLCGRGRLAAPKRAATVNDTRSFDIVFVDGDFSDVDDTITARCTNVGTRAEVWVDTRVDDGRISQALLDELASWLDSRIVPREESTFGTMMDPDEDGKVLVLFTPAINAIPGQIGGMFTANDLQPEAAGSNSADVVYIQVPDELGEYDPAAPVDEAGFLDCHTSTPAHELQHLINFSNRLRQYQAGYDFVQEEYWLNEGLSHFTEDWAGFQSRNNLLAVEHYILVSPWVALPGGETWNPSVFRRGAGYLLVRYLTDRFGEGVLPELLQRDAPAEPLRGWENAEAAAGETLGVTLVSCGVAMYASAMGLNAPERYSFALVAADAETGAQHGVQFRGLNDSFAGGDPFFVTEPVAYLLSPEGPASRTFTAQRNALLFIRLVPGAGASARLVISPLGSVPIRAALLRIDSGEIVREGSAGNLRDGALVIGELSGPGESDPYQVVLDAPGQYVFRLVALDAAIEEFAFAVNDSPKPNQVLAPDTMVPAPPGVYQVRISLLTSGTYDLSVSAQDGGTGAYYLLVLPY